MTISPAKLSAFAGFLFAAGCATREAPRTLTQRELGNVTALANALGYVRFFHPTDAAVRANWDAFAVSGIRSVEHATSDDELAATLSSVFGPITSNVRFAKNGAALPTTIPRPDDATHVVFWTHVGVGSPSGGGGIPNNSYHSERVVAPLSEVGRPIAFHPDKGSVVSLPPVPDPAHPMIVALGGGVSMSMPVGLFTQSGFVDEALRTPNPSWTLTRFSVNDRATRLADVALAWSLFTHFYPYFDVAHTDWPAALDSALHSAATDVDYDAFQATLQRLLAALHDGHAFIRPAIPPTHDVRFSSADERVFVSAVGDSAAASGLRIGDEVLDVDNQPIQAKLAELSSRTSGATPQWIRHRVLQRLLDGDDGTRVRLRVSSVDGQSREVNLSRTPNVRAPTKRIAPLAEVAPGVIYLDFDRLQTIDVDTAMPRLQRASAVIVDMRGYPSVDATKLFAHLRDTPIRTALMLTPVITLPNYEHVGFVDASWTIAPVAPRLTARFIFLEDGGDISSEETALGMVETNRLGDIVGEPSAGTNAVVNPFTLPGGYNVYWSGSIVRKRDGTPHHGVGVIPTVQVLPTVAGLRAGRDEVLERAVLQATSAKVR